MRSSTSASVARSGASVARRSWAPWDAAATHRGRSYNRTAGKNGIPDRIHVPAGWHKMCASASYGGASLNSTEAGALQRGALQRGAYVDRGRNSPDTHPKLT